MVQQFSNDDGGYRDTVAAHQDWLVVNHEHEIVPREGNEYVVVHAATCGTLKPLDTTEWNWTEAYAKTVGPKAAVDAWLDRLRHRGIAVHDCKRCARLRP